MGTEVGGGGLVDERVDWKDLLPNHWIVQDARVPSIKLAHVMDDVFELVSGGASSADVIPGYEDSPDLYPVGVSHRIEILGERTSGMDFIQVTG